MSSLLQSNLRALEVKQRKLLKRLKYAVETDHLQAHAGGVQYFLHHSSSVELAQTPETVAEQLGGLDSAEHPLLIIGAGLGELAYAVSNAHEVVVWERDPAVLRLMLEQFEFSDVLASGRLKLRLGVDIVDLAERGPWHLVPHPVLARVYREDTLLLDGVGPRRAAVCRGALYVADLTSGLRSAGFSTYTLDLMRLSHQELNYAIEKLKPEIVACINYPDGLAEFASQHGLAALCWEVDPATTDPKPCQSPTDHTHIFTYRRAHIDGFRAAGFRNVDYVPLAASPERRKRVELSPEQRPKYDTPIAFVGASMANQGALFKKTFVAFCEREGWGDDSASKLERVYGQQRADWSTYRLPELLLQAFPGLSAWLGNRTPFAWAAESMAAEKRLTYIANLGGLGVRVWGDHNWGRLEKYGVRYKGPAGHHRELNTIYSGATINVDVGRLYQQDIVTMRVFEVLACGGFLLTEDSPQLRELFDVGREIETYRTVDELAEKCRHFLQHPDDARAIGQAGQKRVLADHTVAGRLELMLGRLAAT